MGYNPSQILRIHALRISSQIKYFQYLNLLICRVTINHALQGTLMHYHALQAKPRIVPQARKKGKEYLSKLSHHISLSIENTFTLGDNTVSPSKKPGKPPVYYLIQRPKNETLRIISAIVITVNPRISPRGLICKNEFMGGGLFEGGLIQRFTVCLHRETKQVIEK